MQATNYTETNALLDQIKNGLLPEKEAALKKLTDLAQTSQDPEIWNFLGLAYVISGRPDDAVGIFNQLVELFPQIDKYRHNLGTAYLQSEQFAMARYHFRQLVQYGTNEKDRSNAQKSLAVLDQMTKMEPLEDKFRELKIAALRERLSEHNKSPEDYQKLGFLFIKMQFENRPLASWSEITALLEAGQAKHPKALGILELLVLCYSRIERDGRLPNILRQIEKIAPDSNIMQIADNYSKQEAAAFTEKMDKRARDLYNQSQSQDPILRKAAIDDLEKIITRFPSNAGYRWWYAFALGGTGNREGAIHQAEILAATASEEHSIHFNIGQIFWIFGDSTRGRKHLELAYQYATTEQEREDASNQIAYLEARAR
jgi:tetratricopeptide (TPR) repeat protein